MIKFKNNLNSFLLFLIFLISVILNDKIGFADQKSKLHKIYTSCEIQENRIICSNMQINDSFKVKMLDSPYRILLNFKKKFF